MTCNAGTRVIRVDDNVNSTADFARITGVISGTGASNLSKTGAGLLELTNTNTYAGTTSITGGAFKLPVRLTVAAAWSPSAMASTPTPASSWERGISSGR